MMPSKKELHFTVVEGSGSPFSATIKHSTIASPEQKKYLERRVSAYVDPTENEPVIHLLPIAANTLKKEDESYYKSLFSDVYEELKKIIKNVRIENTLAHESLHLTLNKIGETEASRKYDSYYAKNKKKNIWEFD